MHILDKWNSLGEKFWSVHEFMQIYITSLGRLEQEV